MYFAAKLGHKRLTDGWSVQTDVPLRWLQLNRNMYLEDTFTVDVLCLSLFVSYCMFVVPDTMY